MREGWKEIEIGRLCAVLSSKRIFASDYVEKGIPFYRSKEIIHKALGQFSGDEIFISEEKFIEIKNKYGSPKKGDILISSVGNRSGIAYLVKENYDFYFKDGNLIWLKDFSDKVSSSYLELYFRSELGEKAIESMLIGAAQKALTIDGVKKIKLNLPPLETQKNIASILSGYDDLIENNVKRIKILEEMAQQTYEEWFVRMRFPGHESATINPETGLPEGWKNCKMGDILNFTNGFAFKSKDYDEKGIYSIVTIKNVQEGYFENAKFDKILEIPSKVKDSQRLKTGDLVMSLTGNVGRLCFVYGENLLLNQRVCKIDSETIGFVYCTLRSTNFKNKIENLANGAAQQNLSTIDMENLIIDFPKNELIDEFETFVNPLFKSILNLNIQNQRLREARDILLPRLMMGMIEI